MSDWDKYWAQADRKITMPCPPGHCAPVARRVTGWRRIFRALTGMNWN
jgi:hypothetical protein